jgi:arylsulfatase
MERTNIASKARLKPGKAKLRFEFAYGGGGPGKGGTGRLFVDGKKVAEGRIQRTQPAIFSGDETADIGIDLGTPVVEAIGSEAKSRFTGRIPNVTVEIAAPQRRGGIAPADAVRKEAAARNVMAD